MAEMMKSIEKCDNYYEYIPDIQEGRRKHEHRRY